MKLLVADDTKTMRMMLVSLAEEEGYETVVCEDGEQAWEAMQLKQAPRLLLLDWEMPGMTGLEVCKKVREQKSDDPPFIILLTSRTDTDDIVVGLEAGANDYILKPYNPAELKARLLVGCRMLDLQTELNRVNQKLLFQASHDPLTSLPNRRALLDYLEKSLSQSVRQNQPLQIVIGDVDHFKKVNDNYSHLAGDLVLIGLASRFRQILKKHGLVGRYGGEEFMFIITPPSLGDLNYVQEICDRVAAVPIDFEERQIPVTISLGVAEFSPGVTEEDMELLLKQADEALYQAKNGGRNQAVLFQA